MSEYDSILKVKKKQEAPVEKKKKFPVFLVSLVLIILLIIISYLVYYNNILNSKEVFINNAKSILNEYNILLKDIPLKEFNEEKNLIGTISYNEETFNFNLIKNNNNLNFNVSSGERYFNYFLVDNKEYANINNVTSNINIDYNNVINSLLNIEDKFQSINIDKYVKTLYLDGIIPIVEVNLVLDTTNINELLKLNLKDEYQVIITMKNNAIMNEIEEIKIVINNLTKNDRRVIFVTKNQILYKTKNNNYKITLEKNNNDFVVKINKEDNLYSILTGTDNESTYKYTYQIVDKNYTIDINVTNNNNEYSYEIIKQKNEEEKKVNINFISSTRYTIESNFDTFVDKNDDFIKNIYKEEFGYFKDKYLEFIK